MSANGDGSYMLDTFAHANGYSGVDGWRSGKVGDTPVHQMQLMRGSASYTGGAAGIYTYITDDSAEEVGAFEAKVRLHAKFGPFASGINAFSAGDYFQHTTVRFPNGDEEYINRYDPVRSVIEDFKSITAAAEDHDLSDWELRLGFADFSGSRRINPLDFPVVRPRPARPPEEYDIDDAYSYWSIRMGDPFYGKTFRPSDGNFDYELADGNWYGRFYGGDSESNTATTRPTAPLAIVGEFNGKFTNGSVAGAYGATR